jgi:hypothetical protein
MAIIAIDFDGTYSRFPEEFDRLREMFQAGGNEVYIVTARNKEKSPITVDLSQFDKVVYTNGIAKANAVRADIFIDDNPVTLACNFIDGEPHAKPNLVLHQGHKEKHVLWNWEKDRFVSYIKTPMTYIEKQVKESDE